MKVHRTGLTLYILFGSYGNINFRLTSAVAKALINSRASVLQLPSRLLDPSLSLFSKQSCTGASQCLSGYSCIIGYLSNPLEVPSIPPAFPFTIFMAITNTEVKVKCMSAPLKLKSTDFWNMHENHVWFLINCRFSLKFWTC